MKVVLVCSAFKRNIKTISSWEERIIWGTTLPLSGSSNIFLNDKMFYKIKNLSSVQFSCSVMSDSLRLHGLQHTRPPCPSPTPGVYSNLCPSSRWCHPAISSSVVLFSSCLQSFPAPGSFPMSQFLASGDQSIGVSASASVLPVNIQDWFSLGSTG